jgi:hypothetical protein
MSHRYVVRFASELAAIRGYPAPLEVGGKLIENGRRFRLTAVQQPASQASVGRAWAVRDTLFNASGRPSAIRPAARPQVT